jgi:hypothetical protein
MRQPKLDRDGDPAADTRAATEQRTGDSFNSLGRSDLAWDHILRSV